LNPIDFHFAEKLEPKPKVDPAGERDMVCAIVFSDSGLPDTMAAIDATTGGALQARLRQAGFTAQVGEQVVIDLHEFAAVAQLPRYAMLIGLGDGLTLPSTRTSTQLPRGTMPIGRGEWVSLPVVDISTPESTITREALCAVSGAISRTASELVVTNLAIDFTGLTQHHANLTAMTALLRCRLTHEKSANGLSIADVQIICQPAESASLRLTLAADHHQICSHCTEPCFR
jgi:hypothetical protein